MPKKASAVLLVAPPYDEGGNEDLIDFVPPKNLNLMKAQAGDIIFYYSKDDPVVSFAESDKYRIALPDAIMRVFNDRGHFLGEQFPELLKDIRAL